MNNSIAPSFGELFCILPKKLLSSTKNFAIMVKNILRVIFDIAFSLLA